MQDVLRKKIRKQCGEVLGLEKRGKARRMRSFLRSVWDF